MGEVKVTELKKFLASLNEVQLKGEITELFKLFPAVKEYYKVKLDPAGEKDILEKYNKIIEDEFFPDRGFGKLRYSVMKKALEDFRKISRSPENIAELMISYAENGVEFTNEYGDIDQKFYNNIEGMYEKALKFVFEENLNQQFQDRFRKIMEASDGIGWGFSDGLCDLYYSYYEDEGIIKPQKDEKEPDNLRSIEIKRSENNYNEQERRVNEFIIRCGGMDDSKIEVAWCEYLEENLQFPFSAEIIDDSGPLEVGDIIKVTDIEGIFDLYGIVVNARLGRNKYSFPLCLLELVEKNSKNYQLVDDYNLWFSNR